MNDLMRCTVIAVLFVAVTIGIISAVISGCDGNLIASTYWFECIESK